MAGIPGETSARSLKITRIIGNVATFHIKSSDDRTSAENPTGKDLWSRVHPKTGSENLLFSCYRDFFFCPSAFLTNNNIFCSLPRKL